MPSEEKKILIRIPARRKESEERRVPISEAARLSVQGKAVPVLGIKDDPPPLPAAGLELGAALELIAEHPAPWAHGFVMRAPPPTIIKRQKPEGLSARESSAPASWLQIVGRSGLEKCVALMDAPDAPETITFERPDGDPLTASPRDVVVTLLELCLREYRTLERTRAFLGWLVSGALLARGVWEEDLAELEMRDIPAKWWGMDVYLSLGEGELWERTPGNDAQFTRRWSHVLILPAQSVLSEQERLTHTGAPGRPSAMHVVEAEFDRRVEAGEIEESLAGQARALAAWFETTHPELPRPTPKTVENRLRGAYRKAKSKAGRT